MPFLLMQNQSLNDSHDTSNLKDELSPLKPKTGKLFIRSPNNLQPAATPSPTSWQKSAELTQAKQEFKELALIFLSKQMLGCRTCGQATVVWPGHRASRSEGLLRVTSSKETLSHTVAASRRRGLDQNTGFARSSSLQPAQPPRMIYNAHATPKLKSQA